MRNEPRLNDKAMKELDEKFSLEIEAMDVLRIIVAEFESDPLSVQCFDLRVVEKAKRIVKRLDELGF